MRDVPDVALWIDICVCLPLTILFMCCVCYVGRRDPVPIIYYINLLISNLIQLCIVFAWVEKLDVCGTISLFGVMANIDFNMCIVLERYFFITCLSWDYMRQTKGSVLVCVFVWTLCTVSVPLATVLQEFLRLIIYALLPAPLFIFCLAGTFKALPAATSVPTEEKRRIVGTLILLLLKYSLLNLPAIILLTFNFHSYHHIRDITEIILFLLIPFMDLILFFLMRKGPIDKLLACLCSCSMDNTAGDVNSRSSV